MAFTVVGNRPESVYQLISIQDVSRDGLAEKWNDGLYDLVLGKWSATAKVGQCPYALTDHCFTGTALYESLEALVTAFHEYLVSKFGTVTSYISEAPQCLFVEVRSVEVEYLKQCLYAAFFDDRFALCVGPCCDVSDDPTSFKLQLRIFNLLHQCDQRRYHTTVHHFLNALLRIFLRDDLADSNYCLMQRADVLATEPTAVIVKVFRIVFYL